MRKGPPSGRGRAEPASDSGLVRRTYEGFAHDPSWFEQPEPGYLDATLHDLRRLPAPVQADAVLVDAFEVSWSTPHIRAAIDALADAGRPLRHLYCLGYGADGAASHIQQLANATGDVEETRAQMVAALDHLPGGERGFLIWQGDTD